MSTWSLFSDGSSLTPALRSLPGFSSIKAEAGVWLVHNPVTLGQRNLGRRWLGGAKKRLRRLRGRVVRIWILGFVHRLAATKVKPSLTARCFGNIVATVRNVQLHGTEAAGLWQRNLDN